MYPETIGLNDEPIHFFGETGFALTIPRSINSKNDICRLFIGNGIPEEKKRASL
jgi:hypothetical protein